MRKLMGMLAIVGAFTLAACNTVDGVGRDVSSAGDAVSNTVDGAK